MGGGASKQKPNCGCKTEAAGYLPYDVYEAARTGLPGPVLSYLSTTKGSNVNATYKGETMLHVACANGRESVLTLLLNQKGLCLNIRNAYNETALMLAAGNGYRDCVEIMLVHTQSCPLEIHCKNNNNLSAMDIAHINNRQDVAYCMQSFLKNRPPPTGGKKDTQPRPAAPAPGNNDPSPPPPPATNNAPAVCTVTSAAAPAVTTARK